MIDTLITGARVIDGTGNPWFYGDVAITDDCIAQIAPASSIDRASAQEVVDAPGMVVCPGFIDIQSHSIVPFLTDRRSLSKVTQGVTTEIMGEAWTPAPFGGRIAAPFEEGLRHLVGDQFDAWVDRARGWTRFGDWLADLEARGVSVNVGSFIGGSTIREFGKGEELGDATPTELDAMRGALASAMEDGSFGLATALIYPPGAYAGTAELVALCEVVAAYHGVHITHIRSESVRLIEALEEAIEIAERTGVATEVYHLKAAGRPSWPKMTEVIARIDAARAAGIDITADMYPYDASGTGLASCLPPWASADGKLYENLSNTNVRERIREEMMSPTEDWESLAARSGPENVLIAQLTRPELLPFQGKRLAEIAAARNQHWTDAILDLLSAEGHNIPALYFAMSDENIHHQMRQPWIKFSTDAGGIDPTTAAARGLTHPRAYGTYPRVLGRYVRESQVIPLEDAIRKMTSSVADRLGLRDRGLLRNGMLADVVIFDPATITDHSTYTDPHQLSTGVNHVWVNGVRVLQAGVHTGAMAGRRVKRPV